MNQAEKNAQLARELDIREGGLNDREQELDDREESHAAWEEELDTQEKELEEREQNLFRGDPENLSQRQLREGIQIRIRELRDFQEINTLVEYLQQHREFQKA